MLPGIFLALPVYAGFQARAFQTILQCFGVARCEVNLLGGCPDVAKARSELVGRFLETSCEHLLFIDADIGFAPQVLLDMLSCEVDIILAAYREKNTPHHWTCAPKGGSLEDLPIVPRGLEKLRTIQVERAGLGTTLIRREVFEEIQKFHRELFYRSDATQEMVCYMFAPMIEEDKGGIPRHLSEDASFYRRAAAVGFSTHVLLDATVDHSGVTGNLGKALDESRAQMRASQDAKKVNR
jgi:hypothetical protein